MGDMVRCSRRNKSWQCPELFAEEWKGGRKIKMCPKCRSKSSKDQDTRMHTEHGREYHMNWMKGAKGKTISKKHASKPESKKAARERQAKKLLNAGFALRNKVMNQLWSCLKSKNKHIDDLLKLGSFTSKQDVRNHFKSTFKPGMTWSNYGRGENDWSIGHRIPIDEYDLDNDEDFSRCFHRSNLRAEWHRAENLAKAASLPPSDELVGLSAVYPSGW